MKTIAVLSGKGGAGKTFVTVNLAVTAQNAVYVDCDVEEPNGYLFLKPSHEQESPVYTALPEFEIEQCMNCRKCVDFCRFHALAFLKSKPLLFPEICHACGGCELVCPSHAIHEIKREIGVCITGERDRLKTVTGKINLGEASGVKVIQEAVHQGQKFAQEKNALLFLDCPPGSACSVMESIADADYCVLVAEPTAFGFHNFQMVYTLATLMKKPLGVVVNKMEEPFLPLEEFCKKENIPILSRILYKASTASLCASGKIAVLEDESIRAEFKTVLSKIMEVIQ